jgi:SRSO17 transposase
LRDIVGNRVVEHLAADDAVPVIDETRSLKQGRASCCVGRQYTGSVGKITKCQIVQFQKRPPPIEAARIGLLFA